MSINAPAVFREIGGALHLYRTPDNPLLVDLVAVSFIGHGIAIGDVAFFAPGFQTLKGSALANHVDQVAGNKEANSRIA
ncbi:hypothetical protein [Phyllobacterium sophorae]|uniref:Uncharacterized protein n=1 Tax=Phyllobacterium sophorae TaxID=1520277 RepID=A0A2P7BG75_9HYPH|nr:hypothetical protein [Phyllobacterium sophorae]PSH65467.1 hypothetical protein CU103_10795 [Phyllobacterium sophorae]